MAFGDGNIISHNNLTKVQLHLGFSSTISDSFTRGAGGINGVTADDGPDLYVMNDGGTDKFLHNSGFSSTVTASFTKTGTWFGITHDGTNLYSTDDTTDTFKRHSGFSSTISSSFSSATVSPRDISIQLGNVFTIHNGQFKWRKHDGFSTTVLDSFSISPVGVLNTGGVTQDATDTYGTKSPGTNDKVVKFSGFSSTITDSYSNPNTINPVQIEWDDFGQRNDGVVPTVPQTIQAKARIENTVAQTIQTKARVTALGVAQTIQAKANISGGIEVAVQTIETKARMMVLGVAQTVQTKGRITVMGVERNVQTKASIFLSQERTAQARARLQLNGVAKTLSAKARILALETGYVTMNARYQEYPITLSDKRVL